MRAYVIRRLLLIIPTMLLVTIILFLLVRFVPGNVIDLMVAEMATESGLGAELTADYLKKALGLDVAIHVQYMRWLSRVIQGDLGNSLWTGRSITEEVVTRLPVTAELGILAIIIAVSMALPIGIYSAIRQDAPADYAGRTFAILGLATPNFWIATMVVVYPSIWWNRTISVELIPFLENPMGNLLQFMLPAIVMGTSMSAALMRMTRTMMLEVLRQDYIRTGWSKGLPERTIILRHALKNAFIPIVTLIGPMLILLLGGSVIMEQIFCLPGMGRFFLEALNKRDYPVICGVNVIVSFATMIVVLLVDLSYAYLDPRIRYR